VRVGFRACQGTWGTMTWRTVWQHWMQQWQQVGIRLVARAASLKLCQQGTECCRESLRATAPSQWTASVHHCSLDGSSQCVDMCCCYLLLLQLAVTAGVHVRHT